MERETGVHPLQSAEGNHTGRAAPHVAPLLADLPEDVHVKALLSGLEDQADGPAEQLRMFFQIVGRPQEHGHMGVVAAGVHFALIPGGVGHAAQLLNGQGVHIRPDGHRFAGGAARDVGNDPGAGRLFSLDAILRQLFQNIGRRLCLLKPQLRALVEVLIVLLQLRQIGLDVLHSDHRAFLLF